MDDAVLECNGFRREWTRREVLAHCTALALAGMARGAPGAARQLILVVGDSLSAEYGLARGTGWVALLEQWLAREKIAATVVNASISGDTTSGGLARLAPLLKQHQPTHVVIELGGNDALRGLPLAGAKVVIVGMQVPPNYGRKYGDEFAALFADVAHAEGAALVPFLLKGVADAPDPVALFQPDRIHPLAAAHPRLLENVLPVLRPLLK